MCYNSQPRRRIFKIDKYTRINGAIRAEKLRVIDQNGSQLGVLTKNDALKAAQLAELDLVEVSPDADPPVAKIVDWGKYNYQKTKQLQKSKRNSHVSELKQMRFGLKISDHDLDVKLKKVISFLEEGDKVRLAVVFKGRELAHKELGYRLVDKITDQLKDVAVADQPAQFAGRQLSISIRSIQNAKAKKS